VGVHYQKNVVGAIRRNGLRPVTIDVGGGVTWQGGVLPSEQQDLIRLMSALSDKHPESEWQDDEYKTAVKEAADREAAAVPKPSVNGKPIVKTADNAAPQPTEKSKVGSK
jgi:hypothetical protein